MDTLSVTWHPKSSVQMEIVELNQIEALEAYRADWESLWRATPQATFFQTLDWLEVYWRHFGGGQRLRVLLAVGTEGLVGILPLVVRRESTRAGRVRVLTYPLHDWGSFYGPLGADPATVLQAGLEHVARTPRDWDMIELRWLGAPGTDWRADLRGVEAAGIRHTVSCWAYTGLIDLSQGWAGYWASRSKKWQHNVNRQERRLAEHGELAHVRCRPRGDAAGDADPAWDLYDACEETSRRSWQGSSTTGTTLCHPAVRAYLRDTHRAAAHLGAADLNLLFLAGRPLAFSYNYVSRGSVYGLRMGFDGALARSGAGNILVMRQLRDSCERGDRLFDFGAGYFDCKRPWLTAITPIWRWSHYHPASLSAQLLRLKRWTARAPQPADLAVASEA